ncbi:cdc42 effector protein 2 [Protopterus annectens]|uniref:cdc42 effector protein 2 n=1 Tax=Protopterus annectens TaxID=7888 RepID=UPI001CFBD165|nr:cdc42 effector protein 2 [Protopterus annectens]XP_043931729.1 cdc42 effector protein 2 [Protopterus annectens]
MSTKAPIYLKRGSRKGKKEKLRDILSSDMISPPLGDFRHTIHIGSGGENDMFGDISFLQGKFHLLPTTISPRNSQYGMPFEFGRTATISSHQHMLQPENSSPLLKNAISLPVIGGPQALTLPSAQAPPKPPRLHLEDKAVHPASKPKAPQDSRATETQNSVMLTEKFNSYQANGSAEHKLQDFKIEETVSFPQNEPSSEETAEEPFLSHAGSLFSLHLDLGPSILDDVLQIMDKHQLGSLSGPMHDSRHQITT